MANTELKHIFSSIYSVKIFSNIDFKVNYSSFDFNNKIIKPREIIFFKTTEKRRQNRNNRNMKHC